MTSYKSAVTYKVKKGSGVTKTYYKTLYILFVVDHLPLIAVGLNPDMDFGFLHVRKLSS
jgi:hypothetical protein